jgi:hypothetical protein
LDSASEIIPGLSDAPDRIPGFYAQSQRFQVRMIPPALPPDLIRTMLATGRDGGRRQEAIKRTCLQATAPYLIASTWWIVPGTLPTERKSLAAVTFFAGAPRGRSRRCALTLSARFVIQFVSLIAPMVRHGGSFNLSRGGSKRNPKVI